MLAFFKINHENCLEWTDTPDPLTFIVVINVVATSDRGFSACIVTNQKVNKKVAKKCTTDGHSTLKMVSQFDVALETSISCLSGKMIVIGQEALKAFLEASGQPFTHAGLKQVLETAIENRASNQEEEDSLRCPSLLR